jgi:SAM-dependent methyltransferase
MEAAKHTGAGWTQLYEQQMTPWNIGQVAPPLKEVLSRPEFSSQTFRHCLVPGCGQGYDVAWLSSRPGCELSVGLDISPIPMEQCKRLHPCKPNVRFEVADFFKFTGVDDVKQFDLIFDYTFLCALPPSLRGSWGEQMAKLVKPNGVLVTLIFPIGDYEGGPPFAVSTELYTELLSKAFKLVYGPAESPSTVPQRQGREKMAVWRRLSGDQSINSNKL